MMSNVFANVGYQLFPTHSSLGLEYDRLLLSNSMNSEAVVEDTRAEFQRNGVDVAEDRVLEEIRFMETDMNLGLRPFCGAIVQPQRPKNRSKVQAMITEMIEKSVNPKAKVKTICVFCRNNGESETVYRSHRLKDGDGRCRCPILRAHVCELCHATGDNAHTRKYCPMYSENVSLPYSLDSTTISHSSSPPLPALGKNSACQLPQFGGFGTF